VALAQGFVERFRVAPSKSFHLADVEPCATGWTRGKRSTEAELARRHAPGAGYYAVAALAGLGDVDAITLSMAEHARAEGASSVAVGAIVTAASANSLAKCGLVLLLGSRELGRRILAATLLILASGVLALVIA
jgi:uncharacterized membrane protein (DUF4010 family)